MQERKKYCERERRRGEKREIPKCAVLNMSEWWKYKDCHGQKEKKRQDGRRKEGGETEMS